MIHVVFWFVQDFLSVLTWGTMQVPEIFLLSLAYRLLTRDRETTLPVIWWAFTGGFFWDLRWVGIPGFYTLSYVCVIMAVMWAWNTLPVSGRTPPVIFFLFWAAQMVPPLFSLLLPGRDSGDSKWAFFVAQQGCVVPLALFGVFFFIRYMKDHNA
jgi:hypothetical protein